MVVVGFVVFLALLFVVFVIVLYDVIFSSNKHYMGDDDTLPHGEGYNDYHGTITKCVEEVRKVPFEEVQVLSHDGLVLKGKYYHLEDNAPIIMFFHGYRCSAIRDGNGIFLYTRKLGFNVLLADQRAHGNSQGKTITFGVKERYDVRSWVEYFTKRFGTKQKIYLSGLSMGGATVLMASDIGLPKNVIGILADCPYSSPKAILCSVIRQMHFPVKMTYALARLSASWMGQFDVEEASAIEAVRNSQIPTLIIHGDADDFVPCSMSMDCQLAGENHVQLVLIKGAAHGMSHCVDTPSYEEAVYAFFQRTGGI
ncbi:MAG: alpha/beta hydrolase [Agathobacter sp.]|nr:alpha/beta hydrolase [Agathobacter sp.]